MESQNINSYEKPSNETKKQIILLHTKSIINDVKLLKEMLEIFKKREFINETEKETEDFIVGLDKNNVDSCKFFELLKKLDKWHDVSSYFFAKNYKAIEEEISKKNDKILKIRRGIALDGTELGRIIRRETEETFKKEDNKTPGSNEKLVNYRKVINYLVLKKYFDMHLNPENYGKKLPEVVDILVKEKILPKTEMHDNAIFSTIQALISKAEGDISAIKDNDDIKDFLNINTYQIDQADLAGKIDAVSKIINEIESENIISEELYNKIKKEIMSKYELDIKGLENKIMKEPE